MKFIVDVMLGKLAKWLRILGYDTLFDNSFTDDDLFFTAHKEKRILLTRDKELAERMNPEYSFFISEFSVQDQIRQVVANFELNIRDFVFTRCILCNSPVRKLPKEKASGNVPDYVFHTTEQFYYCPTCDKIYWPGTHIKNVRQALRSLSEENTHEK